MGKIKLEDSGTTFFIISGKSFLKGQYVIEYTYSSTDNSGNLINSENIQVFLRAISNNQRLFPLKTSRLWTDFIDVNDDPYPDFETFSEALATITATPTSSGVSWGEITGTLNNQTDLQNALDGKVDENSAITGATKTKITYDAKGLVTSGDDATTADIADSTNKRYQTDTQQTNNDATSSIQTQLDNRVKIIYKSSATSSAVTGTTAETQVLQVTIPANTFASSDQLYIPYLICQKTGTAGTLNITVKISTSNTLPSGTTGRVGGFTGASGNLYYNFGRNYFIDGGNIGGFSFSLTNSISDIANVNNAPGSQAFDVTVVNYLYVSFTLSNSADSAVLKAIKITN